MEQKHMLVTSEDRCIPLFTRASDNGFIRIVFNNPLKLEDFDNLDQVIADSGAIQLQLVSMVEPRSEADTMFSWSLGQENHRTLLI